MLKSELENTKYETNLEGEAVPPVAPVAGVLRIQMLHVKIYISEKMLSGIYYGQKAIIRADGLDRSLDSKVA